MSKSTIFFGQPIFSQMLGLLNKNKIDKRTLEYKTDHYCKRFTTFQHLITIIYGVTSGCNSLRELCGGIVSYGTKIAHCKFDYSPKRSTISDANQRRDCKVFEDIYYDLVEEHLPNLSDSHKQLVIDKKTYAIDSTTIPLFQPIFECVGRNPSNGKRKGGVKSHQKLDMQAGIPVKVYHSDAREHDSLFIQHQDVARKGEVLLFDKAYNNYALFDKWNKKEIYFVTRLKNNAKETFIKEFDLLEATPDEVLRDAKIALEYKDENGDDIQVELRLVSYYHKEKNKAYYFLTNLFDLPAEQIALLYKKRWEIELLFKKIKQNFPLQYFYGENKNAIQIQIWCTLIALLLISVMKKKLTRTWSFSNLVSLLQKHLPPQAGLFTYVEFTAFFNNIDSFAQEYVRNKRNPQNFQQKMDLYPT
ncbi:MAG: IS4 family transposase [Flavobacteriaceae bacterium]|nr:IS4 family transposase [Flavobacteriaceae bacterium]